MQIQYYFCKEFEHSQMLTSSEGLKPITYGYRGKKVYTTSEVVWVPYSNKILMFPPSPCYHSCNLFYLYINIHKYTLYKYIYIGLSRWLSGKESALQCGRPGFDPWIGKIPGGGQDNPLQYSWLGNSMDRGVWQATVHRVIKSQRWLKWLSLHIYTCISMHGLSSWLSW